MTVKRLIEIDDPDAQRLALEAALEQKKKLVERLRGGLARAAERRAAEAEARVVRRTELVAKRAEQARRLLARWEKRVAFAQRKVRKLRARVRYYSRRSPR